MDRLKILVVDDDERIVRTFQRILKKKGYQTDTAQTGQEAIRKAKGKTYDLALIDICLPDMSGLGLLDKLADLDSKMVKIMITGFPIMAPEESAKAAACLVKPVKPQELLQIIELKIKRRREAI
jgi:two-component system phosphoglycerate transport system response regulator PgtA